MFRVLWPNKIPKVGELGGKAAKCFRVTLHTEPRAGRDVQSPKGFYTRSLCGQDVNPTESIKHDAVTLLLR